MTHVQIHAKPLSGSGGSDQEFTVSIDGVDISEAMLARDISITIPESFPISGAEVTFTVHADILDLDLPQAVLMPLLDEGNILHSIDTRLARMEKGSRAAQVSRR